MNKDLLYKAAEIKRQIKTLTEEYEEIIVPVIAEVLEAAPDTLKIDVGDLGRFSISFRKVWEYTDEVGELDQQLKIMKQEQEQLGLATYKEVPSLKFTGTNK